MHALVRLAVECGDNVLQRHLETHFKNATYMSNPAQNELLSSLRDEQTSIIVSDVQQSHYYGTRQMRSLMYI